MVTPVGQRSFDDLGLALSETTFVVVDLETTGGDPAAAAITEIGALRYRGGELLGTFHTLVNPGVEIPPMITVLTGITNAMVAPAPRIAEVLPAFLPFAGVGLDGTLEPGTVLVGHNVRFDAAFLDAALTEHGRGRLPHRRVDTLALARRLVRDEVPNLRLATLARHLRATTEPTHRALDDARATVEVLHALLERAACFGVLGLDDLLALPTLGAHPSAHKLKLTAQLPRGPGVYLLRDAAGRVLYVGKATNVRARVRSYFGGDDRRKVPQLLRETAHIDHRTCAGPLEAAVRELRLIHEHFPRYNRRAKGWRSYAYLKFTLGERFPRLSVVREAHDDGAEHLGPLHSSGAAHEVREAIESALPVRRCGRRIGRRAELVGVPCVPAQLGVAACPCTGTTSEDDYAHIVDRLRRGLRDDPTILTNPLERRMQELARAERFEEAAVARDRLRALTRALARRQMVERLRRSGRVVLDAPEGRVELVGGRLVLDGQAPGAPDLVLPPARSEIDELLVVARWLDERAAHVRMRHVDAPLASTLPRVGVYEPPRRAVLRPGR